MPSGEHNGYRRDAEDKIQVELKRNLEKKTVWEITKVILVSFSAKPNYSTGSSYDFFMDLHRDSLQTKISWLKSISLMLTIY